MAASDYDHLYEAAGRKHNVDPGLLRAIAHQESRGNPKAVSPQGAIGLMQIMPATAKGLGVDPTDPTQAVDGAARLLSEALTRNKESLEDAIKEYHGGPDRGIWGPKTRRYGSEVMAAYQGAPEKSGGSGGGDFDESLFGGPDAPSGGADVAGFDSSLFDVKPEAAKAAGAPTIMVSKDNKIVFGDTGTEVPKGQSDVIVTLTKAGRFKEGAPQGSLEMPFVQRTSQDKFEPGAYYISAPDKDGKSSLQRMPGGESESSFTAGLGQGVADIGLSLGRFLPATEDSALRAQLEAGQMRYDAQRKGDPLSGAGRFTGQVLTSAPLVSVAGGALAPMARFLGPAGELLAGTAGRGVQGLKGVALRGASTAATGASEGAAASALVSSASDEPVGKQMLAGALLGAPTKLAGDAIINGATRFIGGAPLRGAAPLGEQQARQAMAEGLPVPVPLSRGDLTGAPGAQMEESALLRGAEGDRAAKVLQDFKAGQQESLRANVSAIAETVAGKELSAGEGAKAASQRLNAMRDAAKKDVDAAYDAARAKGEDAMLSTATDVREGVLEGLRREYDLDRVRAVASEMERFGEKGAPTVREMYDMRSRLTNLSQSGDDVEAGAARKARTMVDAYIQKALDEDLFLGDPSAVKAWKEAVGKRADFGRLFEGHDLIETLTERTNRGGGATLKADPEEAVNYIFGKDNLGFATKTNMGRDLERLRKVLGPNSEEWNALRSEAFMRVARAGEGAPEGGQAKFSGQNFFKAWDKVNKTNPRVMDVLFSSQERKMIDDFAKIAQEVTTPVKGGDNASNSAIAIKRFVSKVGQYMAPAGGAAGGFAAGGPGGAAAGAALGVLMKEAGEILAAAKAQRITSGAKPKASTQLRIPGANLARPVIPASAGVLSTSLVPAAEN